MFETDAVVPLFSSEIEVAFLFYLQKIYIFFN